MLVALFKKALFVKYFTDYYADRGLWGSFQVLLHDSFYIFITITIFYVSILRQTPYVISVLLRIMALLLLILYMTDVYVMYNFNSRLVIDDVIKYSGYAIEYLSQINKDVGLVNLTLLLLISCAVICIVFNPWKVQGKFNHFIYLSAISSFVFCTMAGMALDSNKNYTHSWVFKNIIDYNTMVLAERKQYSTDFVADFKYLENQVCYNRKSEKKNIIILMVESLSVYQSKLFSGIKDWTPRLDSIAKKHIALTNFHANGFTTEDGVRSLLTGEVPVYPPATFQEAGGQSFNGVFGFAASLPNVLKEYGYRSEFLTTADLSFSRTGEWAESVGFDYVEGHEHPYYDDFERFHFQAAADEALYNRVFSRIELNQTPYFIFIKTVSTHHPFFDPVTKEKSEEKAFRYADDQIGKFYDELKQTGFFENGLMMIVGDHHAMVPIKKKEVEIFGAERAPAMIPFVMVYGDERYINDDQYQQIDVYNSLNGLVSGKQCYTKWIGDIWGGNEPINIVHRRGDNRHLLSVFSEDSEYLVLLDGNDTRVIEKEEGVEGTVKEIVDKINHHRILRE